MSAVFIGIFATLASVHMFLFTHNKKRGHFFVFSYVSLALPRQTDN